MAPAREIAHLFDVPMSKPRFLLDEHINRAVQRQLRRLDACIEVLAIGDGGAPPTGTPDPEVLIWIEEHGYILVTENRRTIPKHLQEHWAAGRHVPGIFFLRPRSPLGATIEDLYLIWSVAEAEEFQDQVLYLPL